MDTEIFRIDFMVNKNCFNLIELFMKLIKHINSSLLDENRIAEFFFAEIFINNSDTGKVIISYSAPKDAYTHTSTHTCNDMYLHT